MDIVCQVSVTGSDSANRTERRHHCDNLRQQFSASKKNHKSPGHFLKISSAPKILNLLLKDFGGNEFFITVLK